jgi:hypothetical protein
MIHQWMEWIAGKSPNWLGFIAGNINFSWRFFYEKSLAISGTYISRRYVAYDPYVRSM